jgi:hypothetical protein
MSQPLLLDEMFTDDVAQQLRIKGYDVISVVADPALVGRPDDQILAYATTEGRTLVTANVKDFVPLDTRYRAADQSHAGLSSYRLKLFRKTAASLPQSQRPLPRYSVVPPRSSQARWYSLLGAESDASPGPGPRHCPLE